MSRDVFRKLIKALITCCIGAPAADLVWHLDVKLILLKELSSIGIAVFRRLLFGHVSYRISFECIVLGLLCLYVASVKILHLERFLSFFFHNFINHLLDQAEKLFNRCTKILSVLVSKESLTRS